MAAPATDSLAHARTSPRRLLADRVARWVVSAGGGAIVVCVLGILVFILVEVLPLASGARLTPAGNGLVPGTASAILVDEYRTSLVALAPDGVLRAVPLESGKSEPLEARLLEPGATFGEILVAPGADLFTGATSDGRVALVPVRFEVGYHGQERFVTPRVVETLFLGVDPDGRPLAAHAGRFDTEQGTATAAGILADGTLAVVRRDARTSLLSGEVTEALSRRTATAPRGVTHLVLDAEQQNLYGGTSDGRVVWWPLRQGVPDEPRVSAISAGGVTALSLLLGDRSLLVGRGSGALAVWFQVRQDDDTFALVRVRDLPARTGPIRFIVPSRRDKTFVTQDDSGDLVLFHSTSDRVLWSGPSPLPEAAAAAFAPKGDAVVLAGEGRFTALEVHDAHPEVSLRTLFGWVWYEGYRAPAFVWQSSGGTDDFEPKLSLVPLLVGTMKGTFFSLVFAIPLGVLAAMYTSEFLHRDLARFVKPVVEIMAALPSVVLGFLAGLYLAPRIERVFPGLLLLAPVLTVLLLATRFGWHFLPRKTRARLPAGTELLAYVAVLALGIGVCLKSAHAVEAVLFGGNFPGWLLHTTGLTYDQRNAVVVGIAMGFAVIPIIFAISEDAFSNVPRTLVSGSLALGATRWQTVTRVVLPTASPGIFSAVMVGFGRAVGETMIVLMATGNTPIMDMSPFNGFRTLSANIAVEIAEAPQGGTLYRTLFLSALLLFVVTFVVNTAAEVVRQRLRRRYAQL